MMSLGLVRTAFGRITALVLSLTVTAIRLPLSGCGGGTVTPPESPIPTVTPLAVDAETTALGLLFMVPGITALDPTAARGRIAELRRYDSFTAFASFLREHLPTEGLAGLNTDGGEYQNLYEACVLEWMGNPPHVGHGAGGRTGGQAAGEVAGGGLLRRHGRHLSERSSDVAQG